MFFQIHSKDTLTPLWHWLKLIQSDSNLIHSQLILMMAVILNSAILDSAILHKPLTQTNSIWFKLIHSYSTWWWQPSWIQPYMDWAYLHIKKTSLIHSDSTWWWQPSWILTCWIQPLPSWIQTPCYLLSDSLKSTLTPIWPWFKLI